MLCSCTLMDWNDAMLMANVVMWLVGYGRDDVCVVCVVWLPFSLAACFACVMVMNGGETVSCLLLFASVGGSYCRFDRLDIPFLKGGVSLGWVYGVGRWVGGTLLACL